MIALSSAGTLLLVWVTFSALVLAGAVAVLVWAVRSGQFAEQDRARSLPLESGIPELRADAAPPAQAAKGGPADVQP
jgi:nitrogen fixation-related uncharacterized protein